LQPAMVCEVQMSRLHTGISSPPYSVYHCGRDSCPIKRRL
jgi:hypothetical protein